MIAANFREILANRKNIKELVNSFNVIQDMYNAMMKRFWCELGVKKYSEDLKFDEKLSENNEYIE